MLVFRPFLGKLETHSAVLVTAALCFAFKLLKLLHVGLWVALQTCK